MEYPDFFKPSEEVRDLRFLEELERNPSITQRELSRKFNIALGVTNACLRRMARKGWIRVQGLNHRRIRYFLTPSGFAEKTRLTLHLIACTVRRYSELKKIIGQRLLEMQRDGLKTIVFYGVSDEMEVALITLQGVGLKLAGIVEDDETYQPQIILGYELEPVTRVHELKPDGILITSLEKSDLRRERLKHLLGPTQICIKDICSS